MENKNVNVVISDGDSFYCHELSANFNPVQFVLDFKSITPRVDPRSADTPTISIKHNVVLVEPFHAKQMLGLLTTVINNYEKQFGAIEKPRAIQIAEDNLKKSQKGAAKAVKTDVSIPSYFG
ncbi:DUF3467 domain-containing protein [Candidatus Woesearchaeota archaeon]|nr:DUF3467 domain-containing protein [Candidatus Woesearchaeota archaeon]